MKDRLDSVENVTPEILEARKRWVAILRSKRYQRLTGNLSTVTGKSRCCLGVACDPEVTGVVLETTTIETYTGSDRMAFIENVVTYTEYLPPEIQKRLGFIYPDPNVFTAKGTSTVGDRAMRLSTLNDSGYMFSEIADDIEKTYITPYVEEYI